MNPKIVGETQLPDGRNLHGRLLSGRQVQEPHFFVQQGKGETMTEHPESFHAWLNLCRVWASLWGCPQDSFDDEQRWGARFRRQISHYMAVQEELDELKFDAEPVPMSREEIDSIVERVICKFGKKEKQ